MSVQSAPPSLAINSSAAISPVLHPSCIFEALGSSIFDIVARWLAEKGTVLAAELRGTIDADRETDVGYAVAITGKQSVSGCKETGMFMISNLSNEGDRKSVAKE